ncbi:hypothetical protein D8B23_14770 [Verminephrobacter aporrectodeae subsp. tuberculatae]|uniref:PKD domain-containing protein n=1 Tax=Verminephrobacter aporrectodeae subsp. tuberculatae TaxID=1110392 RepID=A0ABT3KS44_9BURK|nr:hypothetical protein [Verminephrobacter aporrectodeae]MCW5219932.1 hypothetical protein [Verminephrobacter aporrectodeae subsp. tuberculatae]MCW5289220.1 hypothetical protein [Verminephrobacter aporrectodeae subsp. tuberculatae]MCW5321116.1 hypothetical protein [Verminephrobacter aporrectodeae subsp. tuberculatae]MCW8199647.1 hypothetical protein [Verminephrobacter aporrectodeae subsp. tuberculatae]
MTKNQKKNAATLMGAMVLMAWLTACGGGAGSNLESGKTIGNVATPDRGVEINSGESLAISATADTRGPGISSHRWSIAAKSDAALRAKAPTIQNADCANATTSKKPIAGGAITIAQSRCAGWIVVPITAVDAIWTVTSTATGTDGTISSDSFDLVVKALPLPLFVVHASASANPTLDKPVYLTGLAKTDAQDQGKIKYAWTQMAGPTVSLGGSDTSAATFIPTVTGEYVFRLTGTWEMDDLVRIKTDIVQLRITGPQASDFAFSVKASATPTTVQSSSPVTLSAEVSTREGAKFDSITYKWTSLVGPDIPSTSTNLATIVLAPELPGTYVWSVEATLKSGSHTEAQVSHAKFEVQ